MLEKQISKALGYDSYKDILDSLGLIVTLGRGYRQENNIEVSYADPFYSSYGQRSDVGVGHLSLNDLVDSTILDKIKRVVAAKKKQSHLINKIQIKAYESIKEFLSSSFDIPTEFIENSDITFEKWCRFRVAGQEFTYDGTLIREEFIIHNFVHGSYKQRYEESTTLKNYFNKKQES